MMLNCNQKKLEDRVQVVCKAFGIGKRRANGLNSLLISHFGVAEWAALQDRNKIASGLKSVRKVPVTFKPLKVSVNFGSGNYAKVYITMRDTILLSPAGKQSLKDLASVTTHKKLELTPQQISNMDTLKKSDPTLYEAYAISGRPPQA